MNLRRALLPGVLLAVGLVSVAAGAQTVTEATVALATERVDPTA